MFSLLLIVSSPSKYFHNFIIWMSPKFDQPYEARLLHAGVSLIIIITITIFPFQSE